MNKKKKSIQKQFRFFTVSFFAAIIAIVLLVFFIFVRPSILMVNKDRAILRIQTVSNIETKLKNAGKICESFAYNKTVQEFMTAKTQKEKMEYTNHIKGVVESAAIADRSINAVYIFYGDGGIVNYEMSSRNNMTILPIEQIKAEKVSYGFLGTLPNDVFYYCSHAIYEDNETDFVYNNRLGTMVMVFDAIPIVNENAVQNDWLICSMDDTVVVSGCSDIKINTKAPDNFDEEIKLEITDSVIKFRDTIDYLEHINVRTGLLILLAAGVCILFMFVNHVWLFNVFLKPLGRLVGAIRTRNGDSDTDGIKENIAESTELAEIIRAINYYIEENDSKNRHILEMQENMHRQEMMKRSMEAEYLKQQIKPHFLYNTLGCIRSIAINNNMPVISESITSLISILRYGTNPKQMVAIGEELEIVGQYIDLLNLRFRGKFSFTQQIEPELKKKEIAKLIIQPIVENCINHAYRDFEGAAKIELVCKEEDGKLIITVKDYGCGIDEEKLSGIKSSLEKDRTMEKGVGMYNVNKRIKLLYGEGSGLEIESDPKRGTTVKIIININKGDREQ